MSLSDVPVRSNTSSTPWSWYHFIPVSLLVHAAGLYLGWQFVPSIEPMAVPEPEFRLLPPGEAIVWFDETSGDESRDAPESVDEAFDPFEEEAVEVPELNLQLVKKAEASREAVQDEPEPETAEPMLKPSEPVTTESSVIPDGNEARVGAETGAHDGRNDADETRINAGEEKKEVPDDEGTGTSGGPVKAQKNGPDMAQVWARYTAQLSAHFKRFEHYPEMARKMKLKGTVVISIELGRDGTVLSAQVAESSGVAILDDAALDAAKKASPAPPFPDEAEQSTRKVRIPYRFK